MQGTRKLIPTSISWRHLPWRGMRKSWCVESAPQSGTQPQFHFLAPPGKSPAKGGGESFWRCSGDRREEGRGEVALRGVRDHAADHGARRRLLAHLRGAASIPGAGGGPLPGADLPSGVVPPKPLSGRSPPSSLLPVFASRSLYGVASFSPRSLCRGSPLPGRMISLMRFWLTSFRHDHDLNDLHFLAGCSTVLVAAFHCFASEAFPLSEPRFLRTLGFESQNASGLPNSRAMGRMCSLRVNRRRTGACQTET